MANRKLEGDERKEKLREILSSPSTAMKIRFSMLAMFGEWASGDPEVIARVENLTRQFKTIIVACLRAKTDVDVREVLLALDAACLDYARAIVMDEGEIEEGKLEVGLEEMKTSGAIN